ncbi:glycosyltransferase family 4 protein [Pseudotabrizicola algicola]|uniref:Glycosyltransferase family 4 protein n=1 Tax=Pseudotabrizicola algicola TaxID=2709381 RepID=A0A6B3RII9_9RHOB|nr:glycosyltransferase family 4 protein [Pseudotabrizicola algicola]NEX45854.1 glycosyltransferase family 4 protein [Pseudotabrizicola algicola]
MTPKRVLFIIRSYPPDGIGGAMRSTQALAEGLAQRGHDVHVLRLAAKGRTEEMKALAENAGVTGPGKPTLHILPIRNVYWPYDSSSHSKFAKTLWHALDLHNPFAARDLRRFLADLRPDVVNTSVIDGFSPSILREIRRSGARLIHTMRDYYLICARSGMFRDGHSCETLCGSCKLVRNVNRAHTRHVDLFLSNSAFVAEQHRAQGVFAADKPCAVQWNINDLPMERAPHLPAPDKIVFGFIGRLAPTKGLEKLIEAARLMPAAGRPWEVRIAGGGGDAYVASLKAQARDLPNVHFLGWSDPTVFNRQVDVVICPSVYHEPLPRVIYEAYGFARPVIASDVGGNPEVVQDGRTGFLYPAQDPGALAARMHRFRDMPDETFTALSTAARAFGAHFTADAVFDSFETHFALADEKPEALI